MSLTLNELQTTCENYLDHFQKIASLSPNAFAVMTDSTTPTQRLFTLYLQECSTSQGVSVSPRCHTGTNTQSSPVVITWQRGSKLSICCGRMNWNNEPNLVFCSNLSRAKTFSNASAAFAWMRTLFTWDHDRFLQAAIDSGKFQIAELKTITSQMLTDSTERPGNFGQLGDGPGAQSAPRAAIYYSGHNTKT